MNNYNMFSKFRHSRKGFTLMEMMIVIAIVGLLMWIGMLPYGTYMEQARLNNNADFVSQEWILAHKEVRNGLETTNTAWEKVHATVILKFKKDENKIEKYLYPTQKDTNGAPKPLDSTIVSSLPLNKAIPFEKWVQILSLSGADTARNFTPTTGADPMYYYIEPPYGSGAFLDKDLHALSPANSQSIIIGYEGATNTISRAREILLRTYLQ